MGLAIQMLSSKQTVINSQAIILTLTESEQAIPLLQKSDYISFMQGKK